MRLNISSDMGVGSFVFFTVSLLLATLFESPACATCYQVGHHLACFKCLNTSQTCRVWLITCFPTESMHQLSMGGLSGQKQTHLHCRLSWPHSCGAVLSIRP